ncbi:hypothetical protein [Pantoea ananatis]|uniref:hypothetical protein n=1 Tax=Pantoea ananas TaxID=553 RepID=UPI000CEB492F|nr:hypothetical protein [Pantoea ananatis]AVG78117.1 hypothetical protein B9Q16_19725 [Pantoea ananatis]
MTRFLFAILISFILGPLTITFVGLILLPSNLSIYHFNIHFIYTSFIASLLILALYLHRKSYKYLNDLILIVITSITALSYVLDDMKVLTVFPDMATKNEHPVIFWIVMFKMVCFVDCVFAKILITLVEFFSSRNTEVVTPIKQTFNQFMSKYPSIKAKLPEFMIIKDE